MIFPRIPLLCIYRVTILFSILTHVSFTKITTIFSMIPACLGSAETYYTRGSSCHFYFRDSRSKPPQIQSCLHLPLSTGQGDLDSENRVGFREQWCSPLQIVFPASSFGASPCHPYSGHPNTAPPRQHQ